MPAPQARTSSSTCAHAYNPTPAIDMNTPSRSSAFTYDRQVNCSVSPQHTPNRSSTFTYDRQVNRSVSPHPRGTSAFHHQGRETRPNQTPTPAYQNVQPQIDNNASIKYNQNYHGTVRHTSPARNIHPNLLPQSQHQNIPQRAVDHNPGAGTQNPFAANLSPGHFNTYCNLGQVRNFDLNRPTKADQNLANPALHRSSVGPSNLHYAQYVPNSMTSQSSMNNIHSIPRSVSPTRCPSPQRSQPYQAPQRTHDLPYQYQNTGYPGLPGTPAGMSSAYSAAAPQQSYMAPPMNSYSAAPQQSVYSQAPQSMYSKASQVSYNQPYNQPGMMYNGSHLPSYTQEPSYKHQQYAQTYVQQYAQPHRSTLHY